MPKIIKFDKCIIPVNLLKKPKYFKLLWHLQIPPCMESIEPGTIRPNFGPQIKEKETECGFT
jgi:hypothetical protein